MKNTIPALLFTLLMGTACAQESEIPDRENQIQGALLAAPEEDREMATVLGYTSEGKVVILREGSNNAICLADDPGVEGFNAACYHKDLAPFMTRGRELRAEGKNRGEVDKIREEEAKSGKLPMPEGPSTLHILYGKDGYYDPEKKETINTNLRYVVYIPWATPESTGLPIRPLVPGGPWIMDPGTHKAHIMITPEWSE